MRSLPRSTLAFLLSTAALLLLIAPQPAIAQFVAGLAEDTLPRVTSGGTAAVLVPPDRAVLYVTLTERDTAGTAAVEEVTAARDRILAALAPLGFSVEQVSLWGIGYGRPEGPGSGPPTPYPVPIETIELPPDTAYPGIGQRISIVPFARPPAVARLGVRVVVEQLDELDAVLAALIGAGIESVAYAAFEVISADEPRRVATERAMGEARLQAEAMARAAGGRLGDLLGVGTFPQFAGGLSAAERFFAFAPGFEPGVNLTPNDVAVRVAVTAAWRFVPDRP